MRSASAARPRPSRTDRIDQPLHRRRFLARFYEQLRRSCRGGNVGWSRTEFHGKWLTDALLNGFEEFTHDLGP